MEGRQRFSTFGTSCAPAIHLMFMKHNAVRRKARAERYFNHPTLISSHQNTPKRVLFRPPFQVQVYSKRSVLRTGTDGHVFCLRSALPAMSRPYCGKRVRNFGLVSRPELNESVGIVTSYDDSKNRYCVQLPRGSTVLLMPKNFDPIAADDSSGTGYGTGAGGMPGMGSMPGMGTFADVLPVLLARIRSAYHAGFDDAAAGKTRDPDQYLAYQAPGPSFSAAPSSSFGGEEKSQ